MTHPPDRLTIGQRQFRLFLHEAALQKDIRYLAQALNHAFSHLPSDCPIEQQPILVPVLTGALRFTGELLPKLHFPYQLAPLKIRSYDGTESSGRFELELAPELELAGRELLILEDIVDSGGTLDYLHRHFRGLGVKQMRVCTLLFKPDAFRGDNGPPAFVGREVPDRFMLGFGLDVDEAGRHLNDLYVLDAQ